MIIAFNSKIPLVDVLHVMYVYYAQCILLINLSMIFLLYS